MNRFRTFQSIQYTIITILISVVSLFARAGGGGGYSGGSGEYSGGGGFSSGGFSGGFSSGSGDAVGFIILFILIFVIALIKMMIHEDDGFSDVTIKIDKNLDKDLNKGKKQFMKENPDFQLDRFKDLVRERFYAIQHAWCDKNLSSVRRYISDGVWQRFNVQIDMMNRLQQTDTMTHIHVHQLAVDSYEQQGEYDVIHVGIKASCTDTFTCELDKNLNRGGFEKFIEYWSFIRKTGASQGALSQNNCPSCGSSLPTDLGEVAQCPYCNTTVNSAEYDWILAEITQADDWSGTHRVREHRHTKAITRKLSEEYPDFCRQHIEDKASNAYLQIKIAEALEEPQRLRRFVSDELFTRMESQEKYNRKMLFNHLMLRDVSLVGIRQTDDKDHLYISVQDSSMRVENVDNSIKMVDRYPYKQHSVMVMTRDRGAESSPYSLYVHQCTSCGGPISDTLETNCSYCGSTLNSTAVEWIVTDIMKFEKFNNLKEDFSDWFKYKFSEKDFENIYKLKDYMINNLLVMAYADGVLDQNEEQFIAEITSQVKYPKEALKQLTTEAKAGRLAIKMPATPKSQEKILQMMRRFAEIDGTLDYQEEALLTSLTDTYGELAPQEFCVSEYS